MTGAAPASPPPPPNIAAASPVVSSVKVALRDSIAASGSPSGSAPGALRPERSYVRVTTPGALNETKKSRTPVVGR
jgi:hypothetical protein